MKRIFFYSLFTVILATSCVDLDITPNNIITSDDLLSNEAGMTIYMADLYSRMPFEDFKYTSQWGIDYNGWLCSIGIEGSGEAVNRDGICTPFTSESTPYWSMAFSLLRSVNYMLETLPDYKDSYAEDTYNHYLGEAYYIRATVFYAMARRFGGVPLVTKVIGYPVSTDEMEIARSSEEETWDQILSDFDMAIELLKSTSPKSGYANKYVALSYKAEAMLYAGSVAKYNEEVSGRLTGLGSKTGVRVMGFDESTWQEASNRYFSEAYEAAKQVIDDGVYSLYMKNWVDGDADAQYQNMVNMYTDISSSENIYVREYLYPTATHGFDAYNSPFIFRNPLSCGTCPTLDFVELFDGFDRYSDGKIRVTNGSSCADGEYIMYDEPMDFFANAEPRLRAYVIFPGDVFKGEEIEIRAGIYTGSTPIKPLCSDYSYSGAESHYQHLSIYSGTDKTLYLSPGSESSQETVEVNGALMTAAGANGPFYNNGESCLTGLLLRKWLNPDVSAEIGEGKSDQHFVLMRYAEVLLSAAEAAIELSLSGVGSPDGSDMIQVATSAINEIRARAGAELLTSSLSADTQSRDIVRKERLKELAFEQTTKWDIRRWRVIHYENRDGLWGVETAKDNYSSNSNYKFRGLYPFYSSQANQYFFDAHFQWISQKTFSYSITDYYFEIPSSEVSKSSVIDQQPNR